MEPFITLEELGAALSPRAPRDLSGDVLAELAIAGACDRIRLEAEQQINLNDDDTAIFSGSGTAIELILPEVPVLSVDEVRIDGEVDLDWVLTSSGMLRRSAAATSCRWPAGDGNIEVDYTHGYVIDGSASTLPAELKLLALTLAARAYTQGLARQEATGSTSITYSVAGALDLTAGELAICQKHGPPKAPTIAAIGA